MREEMYRMYIAVYEERDLSGKVHVVNDVLRRHNNIGYMTHQQLVELCRSMLGYLFEENAVEIETCILNSNYGTRKLKSFKPREENETWGSVFHDVYLEKLGSITDVEERAWEFNSMLADLNASGEFISQYDILEMWYYVLKTFEGTEFKPVFDHKGNLEKVTRHLSDKFE